MARTAANRLTLEEFDRIYGSENGWEYWFGEARRKPVPTHLHGILAVLLGELLRRAGYIVSAESDLKIVSDWQPRPDVYGVLHEIEGQYVTKPVDVVFEIRSKDDDVITQCQQYSRIGIPQVFAFDPEAKTIAEWDGKRLVPVVGVKLANGVLITGQTIWTEMELRRRQRQEPPASKVI
jgi:Uma2 family endonuclease